MRTLTHTARTDLAWFLGQSRPRRLRMMREFAEQEIVIPDGPSRRGKWGRGPGITRRFVRLLGRRGRFVERSGPFMLCRERQVASDTGHAHVCSRSRVEMPISSRRGI